MPFIESHKLDVSLFAEYNSPLKRLERSLSSLLVLLAREASAEGARFYELEGGSRALILRGVTGAAGSLRPGSQLPLTDIDAARFQSWSAPVWAGTEMETPVLQIPLRTLGKPVGLLELTFAAEPRLEGASLDGVLELAGSFAGLVAFARNLDSYHDLAAEIACLQLELADHKITDRAIGALAHGARSEATAKLSGHVQSVVQNLEIEVPLRDTVAGLRSQLKTRQLLHDAKQRLQRERGLSEEEAYLTIRRLSRATRTPLAEIARQVLEPQSAAARVA